MAGALCCVPPRLLLNVEWIDTRFSLDGILDDEALAIEELGAYAAAGGRSIVDLTNVGLRRHPEGVRRISEATEVQVVMGCGWYRQPYYPAEALIDRTSTDISWTFCRQLASTASAAWATSMSCV